MTFKEFDAVYQEVVKEVYSHWTDDMQNGIASHCSGWAVGAFDFHKYLTTSNIRYYYAYRSMIDAGCETLCDVGGYWGVFPVTLARFGFEVTMTEAMQYYGEAFDPLFEYIRNNGVEIIDYDPFESAPTFDKKFDFVTIMAVLEHYPHSLKEFMSNVISLLDTNGRLYIEVPNIAYLPKRVLFFLSGTSPLTPIEQIYTSKTPFIGHHHEYTMRELHTLAKLADLDILEERYYNAWRGDHKAPQNILKRPHEWLVFSLWKTSRNCIAITCKRK